MWFSLCFLSNYEQRILSTVAWELSRDLSDNPPYSIAFADGWKGDMPLIEVRLDANPG